MAAARATHCLVAQHQAEVVVLSASEIHAGEIVLQVLDFLRPLRFRPRRVPGREYDFHVNGSRIRALPCRERATASLVIVDEAALVFFALTGTLATSWNRAGLWVLSTPRTRTGFFHEICTSPDATWTRLRIPAAERPRISPEFLAHQQTTARPGSPRETISASSVTPPTLSFATKISWRLQSRPGVIYSLTLCPKATFS